MLVLGRKTGQVIEIDGRIRVMVVRIAGGVVRLGIEAPPAVQVLRGELVETGRAPSRQDAEEDA